MCQKGNKEFAPTDAYFIVGFSRECSLTSGTNELGLEKCIYEMNCIELFSEDTNPFFHIYAIHRKSYLKSPQAQEDFYRLNF